MRARVRACVRACVCACGCGVRVRVRVIFSPQAGKYLLETNEQKSLFRSNCDLAFPLLLVKLLARVFF